MAERRTVNVHARVSLAPFPSGGRSSDMREAFRTFYRSTLPPMAHTVEQESTTELETPVGLDFLAFSATDIATAARACRSR